MSDIGVTTWVGTSWKMNKLLAEATAFASRVAQTPAPPGVQRFLIPPFTVIHAVAGTLGPDSDVLVGAQNVHWDDEGAWTGEVSVRQVKDAGARLVEVGHSERRTHFNETDATVNRKVRAILRHELIPLVCVGEPEEVFRTGGSSRFVVAQTLAALDQLSDLSRVLIAYEPIWAIGAAGRPARPEDIEATFAALTATLDGRVQAILYGGSVDSGNVADILTVPGVDGLFVGRAAWDVENYLALVDAAAQSRIPAAQIPAAQIPAARLPAEGSVPR